MIQMPDISVEAKQRIVEFDGDTLVAFFEYCIDNDELAIADYILNNLMETLTDEQYDQICTIFQAGAERALDEALAGAQVH